LLCGPRIFMDADYGRNLDRDGAPTKAFEPSKSGCRPSWLFAGFSLVIPASQKISKM
jgi:hypothetical protein